MPISSRDGTPLRWSSTRITIFSPNSVRSEDTRKSTSVPSSAVERRRPSCGSRFSAMSMPAMILSRAISPSCTHLGSSITSLSSPSRRCRIRTPFSIGSTWTSLALLLMALFTTRSTRSMIGAASLLSLRPATGSNTSSSTRRASAISPGASTRRSAAARGLGTLAHRQISAAVRRRAHQRLVGIPGVDRLVDVAAGRDDLLDAVAGLELEILHQAEQEGIGHRHGQEIFLQLDRNADALERDFLRNQHDGGRIGRVFAEVHVGKAELERERLRNLLFGRQVHAHEHHAQALAGALVLDQRGAEVLFRDEARLNQALTDFLTHLRPSM